MVGPVRATRKAAIEAWNRRAQSPPVAQVEVYRKALEKIMNGDGWDKNSRLAYVEWAENLAREALLTSKPEPVAPICEKCGDKGWYYKMTGGGPGESLDKNKVECLECKPVAPVRKWEADDAVGWFQQGLEEGKVCFRDLSPEVQDALSGRKP